MAGRGAPLGNKNGSKNKVWMAALERHVARHPKDLEELAEVVFREAKSGNMQAVQEIGNRLDGKPVQPVDLKDDRTAPTLTNAYLAHVAAGGNPDEAETTH